MNNIPQHNCMTSNYHLTRTIPRTISSENLKKKGPVWVLYASKWSGRRNAYDPAKLMRVKINDKQKAQKES